ncbi:MAG: ferritin-like protein [Scytonema sp. PMC 1069.18]|nr:ferritin-like protein [Scytonema sp. PMC 1069.18]MEC4881499.1 ferritin-like protein [Scytonema sp. PMC 1070.18]
MRKSQITQDNQIIELMRVPETKHDLDWLKESLQAAIKLEFATLPPYLAALWSIQDDMHPVARSIRKHIAEEEMLHMALACNLLTAVGGKPALNTPEAVPTYPSPLPGGVNPDLVVPLCALSLKSLQIFLEIEYPEFGPIATVRAETFSTIGAFYTAIQNAFETLKPRLTEERQMEGPFGLSKIRSLNDVYLAIEIIKRQGEGSKASPEDTGPDDLAHYYRFAEIYHGKKLRKNEASGKWEFDGDPVPFPSVWSMAEIPIGGYQQQDVSAEVWQLLEQFDQRFTTMTNQLQAAWENGDSTSLGASIGTMFQLKETAKRLMQIPIPSGSGNYGPCFRLVQMS